MSLHKHVTRIGRAVTYIVVFGVVLMVLLVKHYRFMVGEHAPASLYKEKKKQVLLSDYKKEL